MTALCLFFTLLEKKRKATEKVIRENSSVQERERDISDIKPQVKQTYTHAQTHTREDKLEECELVEQPA